MKEEDIKAIVSEIEAEYNETRRENSYDLYREVTLEEAMGTGSAHDLDPHLHGLIFELSREIALLKKMVCRLAKLDEEAFDRATADVFTFPEARPAPTVMEEGPQYSGD